MNKPEQPMPTENENRDEEISSLLEVEGEIVSLMRRLHGNDSINYAEASDLFTNIHAHAAWTDLAPLAGLADKIWSNLSVEESSTQMTRDERTDMRKNLVTYKFLLNRLMGDYQAEIDAAMAS